jgi:ABC-2 type transport system ATP-binding protein
MVPPGPVSSGSLAIEVRDLHKRFPRTVALAGVSFHVRPGEVVGLLGANGAGKTTTIHVLLGLILPTSGAVTLFGATPHARHKAVLRRVGFASPEALMDWRLTTAENLRVYAGLFGVERATVDRMVDRFELGPLLRQPFGELSLGQQTRAGLARALLHAPDLLILDEPTASLDPDIADKTRRLLHDIRRERGLAILYSSHNMSEVEEACDRVVFIHHGRVVADGTPLAVSRQILGSDTLDTASMEEVFLKISREGAA